MVKQIRKKWISVEESNNASKNLTNGFIVAVPTSVIN